MTEGNKVFINTIKKYRKKNKNSKTKEKKA